MRRRADAARPGPAVPHSLPCRRPSPCAATTPYLSAHCLMYTHRVYGARYRRARGRTTAMVRPSPPLLVLESDTQVGGQRGGSVAMNAGMHGPATVRLRRQRPERLGHPWVFAGEIAEIPTGARDGDVARVVDVAGRFLGMAYLNRQSMIALRYLSRRDEPIDGRWWAAHVAAALDRRSVLPEVDQTDALRLVNAEADGLPGLIVD